MNITENMAQELIATYNSGDEGKTYQKAKELLDRFKKERASFTYAEHHYLMAKAFYYIFFIITDLNTDDKISIVKFIYYHLMENYLKNADADASTPQYRDLLGGCQLGLVIMLRHGHFITACILAGICHIMPNYAQENLFEQILLFSNILYRAEEEHFHYFSDDLVSKDYKNITQGITKYSLNPEEFTALKERCNKSMRNNSTYICASFPMYEYDDDEIW